MAMHAQNVQEYKSTSDIVARSDPAAVFGMDDNQAVPPLQASDAEMITENENAVHMHGNDNEQFQATSSMDIDHAPVKMVVLDGIVMGPQHCAYENCTSE